MIVLRIVRRPDGVPSEPELHPVKPGGSTIGRAPECDIVLDDPQRLVSRRHAWIAPEGLDRGTLRCLSTVAAVLVNEVPVPTGQEHRVKNGDRLRIGAFEAVVEAEAPPVPTRVLPRVGEEATTQPRRRPAPPQPPRPSRLDQWFSLDTVPDPLGPASPLPALDSPDASLPPPAWGPSHGRTQQPPPRTTIPAPAPTEPIRLEPGSAAADAALQRAFLRGVGLDAGTPLAWNAAWMAQMGRLLREATAGTMELLHGRAVAKRNIRAAGTRITARENNPLKFAPDANEALKMLLSVEPRPGFLEPAEAMRAAQHDLQVHQLAMVAGMRAAVLELITRLGPDAIEAAHGPVPGLAGRIPLWRDAVLWRRHRRLHAELLASLDDSFEAAFGREFLRAYEEHSRSADPPPPDPVTGVGR